MQSYTPSTAYQQGQVVSYGGRLYRAEVPSPGGTPDASADYSLLSVLGPTGATGPTGPAGSLPNDALYLQSTASTAPIADGAALWANTPVINRTTSIGLSYNPATGAITAQDAGSYLFLWSVSAQPSGAGANLLLSLEPAGGGTPYAASGAYGANAGEPVLVSGSAIVALGAGGSVTLVNRSGAPVSLTAIPASAGEGFSGSLTAVRIA